MHRRPQPLIFTPLQRHELFNAIRLAVFRRDITAAQRDAALAEIELDQASRVLVPAVLDGLRFLRKPNN